MIDIPFFPKWIIFLQEFIMVDIQWPEGLLVPLGPYTYLEKKKVLINFLMALMTYFLKELCNEISLQEPEWLLSS